MSPITKRIIETIYLLRRTPQIDIERLSYELDEAEWLIFTREMEANNAATGKDLSYADALTFMGLTIRKRAAQGKTVTKENSK